MTALQLVLVYVAAPLLLLAVVGGSAWWSASRRPPPQFPVLRGGRPLPVAQARARSPKPVTEENAAAPSTPDGQPGPGPSSESRPHAAHLHVASGSAPGGRGCSVNGSTGPVRADGGDGSAEQRIGHDAARHEDEADHDDDGGCQQRKRPAEPRPSTEGPAALVEHGLRTQEEQARDGERRGHA